MDGDTNGAGFALPAVPLEPLRDRDPRELGPFRLLGRLGAGGMGVAFLAEGGGQWAVVKMVRSELAEDRSFRARLSRELDAMGRAAGPHTASLLDSDVLADPPWFAMEFIPGMTLTRRVDDSGALVMAEVLTLAAAMVDVLVSVHGAGIVHRDLKPSNIMMSPSGPKLIDFGIADMSEGTQLTKTGMVLGSTGWLAPEQVRGDQVTSATDIHAWALCVLYAATGAPPFGADNSTATMYKVLEAIPVIPQEIPSPLRELLSASVAKEPSHRPTLERLSSELNPVQFPVAPAPTTPVFDTTPTPPHDMLTTLEAAPRPPGRTAPGAADTGRPAGRRWWPVAVGIGALCVVAAVIVVLAGRNSSTLIAVEYMVGDTGPGGGIVFYDAGSDQPWGRYLEAAPAGWNGPDDPVVKWCDVDNSDIGATGLAIGEGKANTAAMVGACSSGAGVLADAYVGGGQTDWFLPSRDELNALYEEQARVGGFGVGNVWSSSRYRSGIEWRQGIPSGGPLNTNKGLTLGVRPVRAFPTPAATPMVESAATSSQPVVEGDYVVGDTGPGGGIVFYDAGSVQPWGRYLEAGPALADEDWCGDWELDVAGTKTTIGEGASNTKLIAAACGSGAANTVSDYDGGGKTDWFLPSMDELNALYEQRDSVGGFGTDLYWSSSQHYARRLAWGQSFPNGLQHLYYKNYSSGVRPVRAFTSAATSVAPAATPAATPTAVAEIAGDYMVGDTGPGGGIVFYDAGSVQPWGRYLEAGPALAAEDWCDDSDLDVAGTKETVGSGKKNTKLIAAACGSGAANTVSDYDGGGKIDWFLPSRGELNALYEQRDSVGGFGPGRYWSSSQLYANDAWLQYFTNGVQYADYKLFTYGVRPVRAF